MSLKDYLISKIKQDIYFNLERMELVALIEKYDYISIIDELLYLFSIYKIPFPYAHFFINDQKLESKFNELKCFTDHWKNEKYSINNTDQPNKPLSLIYTDKNGKGSYNLYQPIDADYNRIDNITCYFTDVSRMSSHRYVKGLETKSPQNGWEEYG